MAEKKVEKQVGPLYVTSNELREEAVSMIESHRVIEIMESYGWDPDDRSGSDMTSIRSSIFANKLGLMANPCTDLHNLFKGFDSRWHNDDRNQVPTFYKGETGEKDVSCIGTEVNYYFQGILFRVFGYSSYTGLEWVRSWKFVSRHGEVNANIEFFFRKGHKELPALWGRAVTNQRRNAIRAQQMEKRRAQKAQARARR